MDLKLAKIALSCRTPEQIILCRGWIMEIDSISEQDRSLLLEILRTREATMAPERGLDF